MRQIACRLLDVELVEDAIHAYSWRVWWALYVGCGDTNAFSRDRRTWSAWRVEKERR